MKNRTQENKIEFLNERIDFFKEFVAHLKNAVGSDLHSCTVYLKKSKHSYGDAKNLGEFKNYDEALKFVKKKYDKEYNKGLIEINHHDTDPAGGGGINSHK